MKRHLTPAQQKKRLRVALGVFFLLLAVPVYLLIDTVYRQLHLESLHQARLETEKLAGRMDDAIRDLIETEQLRPSAEYSFFNVLANPLLDSTGIKFSPLSEIPPQTRIPGVVGFFQINPDGSFQIPALPVSSRHNRSGLSPAELQNRLALKRRLQLLLARDSAEEPTSERRAPSIAEAEMAERYVVGDGEEKSANTLFADKAAASKKAIASPQEKRAKRQSVYSNRKEQVRLPDQAMAGNLFQRSLPSPAPMSLNEAETESDTDSTGDIDIIRFESEVSPLSALPVKSAYLCFYRQVWHDNSRYTQGFVVDISRFFDAVAQPLLQNGAITSADLFYEGRSIKHLFSADAGGKTLLQRPLKPPLERFELRLDHAPVEMGKETFLVHALTAAIALALIAGLFSFYYLLGRQIELSRQQQNFISAVSHELKTPLTSIRLYGEMLRSGWVDDDAKKKRYYDFIFFESERLSRLIANVPQLARIDNRAAETELSAVSAKTLLHSIPEKIEMQLTAAGFRLDLVEADGKWAESAVTVDQDAFFQIIINLVDNAIKFAAEAAEKVVEIGYRPASRQQRIEFFVRDFGPGIPKRQNDKIFRLFYRAGDELTRTTAGTGIGLALVAQLAASMDAEVDVVNRRPGAEFRIRFNAVPPSGD